MKFTELNLADELLDAIHYMGFENATPIQEQAIPAVLNGKDMIACAQTGTGKTAAFILPILNKMVGKTDLVTDTLVIVPTRELAVQIEQQIQGLSYFISVSSKAVYGGGSGKDFEEEKQALINGTDIIVATPGKLLSHLKLGYVKFDKVKHLILDEADRMLDMGFQDDLNKIMTYLPEQRQNLLFSATMAAEIRTLAKRMLTDPLEINLALSKPAEGVDQKIYLTFDEQKNPLIQHLLNERKNFERIILFTSTKSKVNDIVRYIQRKGFKASGISSDLEQHEREETLNGFRSGRIPLLVATDVMSRGIDIKEINMVINYDVPGDAEDYVHRVGRTARANTTGEAVTLVNERDMKRFKRIEDLIGDTLPRLPLPEGLGPGPEWKVSSASSGGKSKKRNFRPKKKHHSKSNPNKPN